MAKSASSLKSASGMPRAPSRFIRLRDAPTYLGMDKNRFNVLVRPQLIAIRIGVQGVAFDRLDLDHWADEYKSRNGRPAVNSHRRTPWEPKDRQASPSEVAPGTSTNCTEEHAFERALEQAIQRRRRSF
jgi:predicted DNA-binding transcriptional regulator AlpA